ncbi:Lon protease family protein [Ideonella sp.]|uniref:Lon protease family protein n=1 Tax=Ideonella sp. TaxID=1929293 RepID=UPI002B498A37|nr:AAA family ATPase [Ideonella sp.]HJV68438.1 AAA family ATPase [Ideonella sp.]
MSPNESLPAERLCTRCDPSQFDFETTATLPEPQQPFGQARAVKAVQVGLEVAGRGYNLFVLGRSGSSRHQIVRRLLAADAAARPAPADWCYVYNFADPNKPRALSLPAGEGARLRNEMHGFVGEIAKAIEAAFESEEYRSRIEAIQNEFKRSEDGLLQALGDKAAAQGVALLHTPQGFAFAPLKDGAPMTGEQIDQMTDEERDRIAKVMGELREALTRLLQQLPRSRRDMQTRIREASRDAMALAAGHLIDELKERFAALPQVIAFLDEVLKDVVEAGGQLREHKTQEDDEEISSISGTLSLVRYEVNLLVGHEAAGHAPVESCDNPSYPNLIGRIDHLAHMGTLLTNFTLIKPGALHQANGGYLLLDTVQLLGQPYAWDGLKRVLRTGQIVIESLPQLLGFGGTLPLEPEPIPVQLKVVLFGEREHYYLLQELDDEFDELFKVAADFEDEVPRDAEHTTEFVRLLGSLARSQGLRPLDRGAAARLVEQAARLAGDAGKLSTRTRPLNDLLQEANAFAGRAGRAVICREDVLAARAAAEHRADRLRGSLHDAVLRDTLLIDTAGAHVGQVNGLAVTQLGEFAFGHPVRITATARLGDGEVVDILRESQLGRPLHSKGVLILVAFLGARYSHGLPLSLRANLVFEQTYGPVEGDSASLAELCALLSALAGAPVRQSLAVTGSINQFGQVQAVGAVNEKIEGFFDVCRARGLNGEQGVLLPRANAQHLMLREDVVQAVAEGRFHVYPVDDVDQAIALLTGIPAGAADAAGHATDGTINHRVGARLEAFSLGRQAYGTGQPQRAAKAWQRRPVVRRVIER